MVTALDVVEKMGEAGVTITTDILHSLLHAIDEVLEFNLVRPLIWLESIYGKLLRENRLAKTAVH